MKIHGHLCPRQVIGVRMALYGLDNTGIYDPKGRDREKLYLFAEMDRCAADALQSVTGCCPGNRTMRFRNYEKTAATFINTSTGKAVRVVVREEACENAKAYFPSIDDKYYCRIEAYKVMPDEELFYHETVNIAIPQEDIPGRQMRRIQCEVCREYIQDMRVVFKDGMRLCWPCAYNGYYWIQEFFYIMRHKELENHECLIRK